MTDLHTMTKAAINALLVTPLTASQLKKISHAELVAMFDAMPAADALDADLRDARADDTPPTPDQIQRDESNHFGIDPDLPTEDAMLAILKGLTIPEQHLLVAFANCENTVVNAAPKNATGPADLTTWVWLEDRKVGDMTSPQKKGVLSSLVKKGLVHVTPDSDGDMLGWSVLGFDVVQALLDEPLPAMPVKASPKPATKAKAKAAPKAKAKAARKLGADVILFLPADSQKEPKAGTKRAAIIDLLRAPKGATVEDIAAATGWSRSVAQSALYVDVKGSGWGVERKEGRLFLLPQEAK